MSNAIENAEHAARLLMMAMTPRTTPAGNSEYGDLLVRYGSDAEFRETVKAIARGMNVTIYSEMIQHGLMLVPQEGSVFAPTAGSFKGRSLSFRERVSYGLLHYILAAYVFPSEDALNDSFEVLSAKIRPNEVARFAVEACEGLKATEVAKEILNDEMVEAYTHLLSLRESDQTATSVAGMIRYILEKYEREGLFNVIEEDGEKVYRSRPHFRAQARFLMQESERRLMLLLQETRTGADS